MDLIESHEISGVLRMESCGKDEDIGHADLPCPQHLKLQDVAASRALVESLVILRRVARVLCASDISEIQKARMSACRMFGSERASLFLGHMMAFASALSGDCRNNVEFLQPFCRCVTQSETQIIRLWDSIIRREPSAFMAALHNIVGRRDSVAVIQFATRLALEIEKIGDGEMATAGCRRLN